MVKKINTLKVSLTSKGKSKSFHVAESKQFAACMLNDVSF